MSSENAITPNEMRMIQSVLNEAGYDANVLGKDPAFNVGALFVMKLFLAGETSPYALSAQLVSKFGPSPKVSPLYKAMLPRYAIQGMPLDLKERQTSGVSRRHKAKHAALQVWENEGGA